MSNKNSATSPLLSNKSTVIKVALIALLWILVINSGMVNADSHRRLQMAHAWWTGTDEVSVPADYKPQSREEIFALVGVLGAGGKRYIPYEPGQSLLMLPADWLGTQLHPWFPKIGERDFRGLIVNFLTFVPLNVAAVVSCFWLIKLFGFEERIASLASITWLLGTTFLHYAQVHQQNNQVLLFVILGYAAALSYIRYQAPRWAILSGVASGASLLIRTTAAFNVFTVFFFLVGCLIYQSRDKWKLFPAIGWWLLGIAPLFLLGRILDYLRYGSFWKNGQNLVLEQLNTDPIFTNLPHFPPNWPFINDPLVGIFGVLFSPAKSIFIYDPFLLPCLVLIAVIWKRISPYIQWYVITELFELGLQIVLNSRLVFWDGAASWGARYQVTSVQLLLVPLIALFIQNLIAQRGLIRWLMQFVIAFAIVVQISSVILMFGLESAQGELLPAQSRYLQFRLGQRFTNIACQIEAYGTNKSFAQKCITGSLESLQPFQRSFLTARHQFALLPFNYARFGFNRKWTFIFWGVILLLALITTAQLLSQTP
jgi:hypothetical protein